MTRVYIVSLVLTEVLKDFAFQLSKSQNFLPDGRLVGHSFVKLNGSNPVDFDAFKGESPKSFCMWPMSVYPYI